MYKDKGFSNFIEGRGRMIRSKKERPSMDFGVTQTRISGKHQFHTTLIVQTVVLTEKNYECLLMSKYYFCNLENK